jgi:flavodoxin
MDPNRTLIVYYSRTGTTRDLARAIRDELGCNIDRIADRRRRRGPVGWLRSAVDSTFDRRTVLQTMSTLASDYELVIVGSPVWNASVATPVRAYLEANSDRIRRVAFFCSHGGIGSGRALRQMSSLSGLVPLATLSATANELRSHGFSAKLHAFAAALTAPQLHDGSTSSSPGLHTVSA